MIGIIKIIILFGIIIGTHELGHFIVAKMSKVKVYEFSIGFGPAILKKEKNETLYTLRLIPLGGYVRLEGEEELSEEEGSFSKASLPKRMLILLAGAFVNILLATVIYFIFSAIISKSYITTIDNLMEGYPGINSIFQVGDEIIEVNGNKIETVEEFSKIVNESEGKELYIKANRRDENNNISIIEDKIAPKKVRDIETGLYFTSLNSTKIAQIEDGSAAEKAGLKINDLIISINGIEVKNDLSKIQEYLKDFIEEERDNYNLELVISRKERLEENKEISIRIEPQINYSYYVGVVFREGNKNLINSIKAAASETSSLITTSINSILMLFSGKIGLEQMSGPIGIANVVSSTNGIENFIEIFALISFNIGLINLLPIPPLDGFKLLLLIIEGIRKKPVSKELELKIELFGFFILIYFSIMVAYSDIMKLR